MLTQWKVVSDGDKFKQFYPKFHKTRSPSSTKYVSRYKQFQRVLELTVNDKNKHQICLNLDRFHGVIPDICSVRISFSIYWRVF